MISSDVAGVGGEAVAGMLQLLAFSSTPEVGADALGLLAGCVLFGCTWEPA